MENDNNISEDLDTSDDRLNRNISQIEALLKRINDENKKTREILDKIDKGEYKKDRKPSGSDTRTTKLRDTMEKKDNRETDEEHHEAGNKSSRVSFAGSWSGDKADDIVMASSMEQKRYPIVMFNPGALSQPSSNPAGAR